MNEFVCSRSGSGCFPELNRTFVRLWFLLICAVICCAAMGCETMFYMHGKVVDADGNPIADAKLVFESINDEFLISNTSSDATGAFTLQRLTSSSLDVSIISISVQKSGFAPAKVRLPLGNNYNDAEIVLVRFEEGN